jgi:hypothetical protein
MAINDATGCSVWDWLTGACGAKIATKAMQIPNYQQIQSVPANAAAAGYSPEVVAIAQRTADTQSAQLPADAASIANYYSTSFPGLNLTGAVLDPLSTVPPWVWLLGLAAGGLLLMRTLR